MISFRDDYSEGAHINILNALVKYNDDQEVGYGKDTHTINAINKIRKLLNDDSVDIHLIPGGTQTNLIAISSFLRPHQACIAAKTGHIATHETGAIEYTGHKVVTIDTNDGKINPEQIKKVLEMHTDEHMVKPKLVYISNSTEVGTVYNKQELRELSNFCKEYDLILFADGARIGTTLVLDEVNITLEDMNKYTDAFYIGGTKNGALLGEALVINNDKLKQDFRYFIKQKGALLAKGRLLGIQFEQLFTDDLYFKLARHANEMARLLTQGIKKSGYSFFIDSPTNQVFPIFGNKKIEELKCNFDFHIWEKIDDTHCAVRLVTSWATKKQAVLEFIKTL